MCIRDRLRVGIQFHFADPAVTHRMGFGHQARQSGIQRFLVQRLVGVEVQPGVGRRDRTAVHRERHQRTQQVRGGVKAPVRLTARRIHFGPHPRARREGRQIGVRRRHVHDQPGLVRVLARIGHQQLRAAGGRQRAGVARLADVYKRQADHRPDHGQRQRPVEQPRREIPDADRVFGCRGHFGHRLEVAPDSETAPYPTSHLCRGPAWRT